MQLVELNAAISGYVRAAERFAAAATQAAEHRDQVGMILRKGIKKGQHAQLHQVLEDVGALQGAKDALEGATIKLRRELEDIDGESMGLPAEARDEFDRAMSSFREQVVREPGGAMWLKPLHSFWGVFPSLGMGGLAGLVVSGSSYVVGGSAEEIALKVVTGAGASLAVLSVPLPSTLPAFDYVETLASAVRSAASGAKGTRKFAVDHVNGRAVEVGAKRYARGLNGLARRADQGAANLQDLGARIETQLASASGAAKATVADPKNSVAIFDVARQAELEQATEALNLLRGAWQTVADDESTVRDAYVRA